MDSHSNPYAPPTAPVRDAEPSTVTVAPCSHVAFACLLLWIGFAVNVLISIVEIARLPGPDVTAAVIAGTLLGLAIAGAIAYWFTNRLRAGRNWMRWLLTIINAVGGLIVAIAVPFLPPGIWALVLDRQPMSAVNLVAQFTIGVALVLLLNTRSSRAWFAEHTARVRAAA